MLERQTRALESFAGAFQVVVSLATGIDAHLAKAFGVDGSTPVEPVVECKKCRDHAYHAPEVSLQGCAPCEDRARYARLCFEHEARRVAEAEHVRGSAPARVEPGSGTLFPDAGATPAH